VNESMRPASPRPGTGSRVLVLLVLAGMLAAAIVLNRQTPDVASTRVDAGALTGSVVPPSDALSTAWYCAAGSAAFGGTENEWIDIANLSPDRITATITVYPGGTDDPATRNVDLTGYERVTVQIAEVLATATPGVVVEVFGGPAIVEHELRGPNDLAMGSCSHEPSRRWYFAGGDTDKGAAQALELFNPFGDDAIVDIAFVTDGGVQEPNELQGFVVGRHSKVVVPIQDLVPRQDRVATQVVARTGRVVAEQTRTFDGTDGRTGLAVSLGAIESRREWTIPFGDAGSGITSTIAVANFGMNPAQVEVSVVLPGDGVLAPVTVDVPSRSVVRVDPGSGVPVGVGYGAIVRALGDTPIVAEGSLFQADGTPSPGAAEGLGAPAPARRWAFAGSPRRASSRIIVVNRATRPVTVELRAYVAGDPNSPHSAPAAVVQPGKQVAFDLDELGIQPDQVLVVGADGPIVAGRQVFLGAVSLATGLPWPE
jgi:hypothetical protein